MTNIKEQIHIQKQRIQDCKIPDALFNVNCMAAKLLNCQYNELYFHLTKKAEPNFVTELNAMVNRRCSHEPLQYILQEWDFLNLCLKVSPAALIPRPETEEMVLKGIELIKTHIIPNFGQDFSFADIGTGTGAIGLAIASQFLKAKGILSDFCPKALQLAETNLNTFPKIKNVKLLNSDLLANFKPLSLNLIISNPPYIKKADLETLMPEVKLFEPKLALDGGEDGLDLIRALIKQGEKVLTPNGILIFEHGKGQQKEILKLFSTSHWSHIRGYNDLYNIDRYVSALKN